MKVLSLVLLLLNAGLLCDQCWSQDGAKTVIPHATFYARALEDSPRQASFNQVAEGLRKKALVLVDVRSKEEFNHSHIKGAVNIPATDLTEERLLKLIPDKNTPIVIYCENNFNAFSRMVPLTTLSFPAFRQLGYQRVQILECAQPPHVIPLELEPAKKE